MCTIASFFLLIPITRHAGRVDHVDDPFRQLCREADRRPVHDDHQVQESPDKDCCAPDYAHKAQDEAPGDDVATLEAAATETKHVVACTREYRLISRFLIV